MYYNVSRYIDFITKNKLTQSQYLFLYLIRFNEWNCIEKYKQAFPTDDGSMIGEGQKKELITLGFLEQVGEGSKASDYRITDKFNLLWLKDRFNAAQEIWDNYPGWARVEGKAIPLMNMDTYQFANMYAERIGQSVEEHIEVLKDLKYGRDNSLINFGIKLFVTTEAWRKLRSLRLEKEAMIEVPKLMNNFE